MLANTNAALQAAREGAASGLPYSSAIAQSGLLKGFRQDCSGFVDFILNRAGVNVGGDTTVSLPTAPGLTSGQGDITLWNRPLAGQAGHVIADISGQWFESGGMGGGGPHQMTEAQAAQELGVSSVKNLPNTTTPRGFSPLTPTGGTTGAGQQSTLAQLWIQAGGDPRLANVMAAIAMAESGGRTDATNSNTDGSTDRGLWQINSVHTQFNDLRLLTDPLYNAQAAVAIEKSGSGLGNWTTYTSGAYKQFLNSANKATYTLTRPGGDTGSGADTGDPQGILDSYVKLRDMPRTAPPDTKSPFQWFLASFTGDWQGLGTPTSTTGASPSGVTDTGSSGGA